MIQKVFRSAALLTVSIGFLAFAAIGNLNTPIEGVIPEDAVTDSTETVQSDAYVKRESNFEEYVYVLYEFGDSLKTQDLRELRNFHNTLVDSGQTVASIVTYPDFQFSNNTLEDRDFLPDSPNNFDSQSWKKRVRKNSSVYGKFVAEDFTYAVLTIKMDQGFDEIDEGRELVEVLEREEVSEWEWYLKDDINPVRESVIPAGYILARITMYGAINKSNLTGAGIGIFLAFWFFWFFFRRVRPAVFAVVNTGLALVITRGVIGHMALMGINTAESVYTILAWASIIIASVSFHTHVFAAMRHVQTQNAGSILREISRGWIYRIWKLIGVVLLLTAVISALNFFSLWTFPVKVIQDLGLHAAFGIMIALAFALFVFPYCIAIPKESEREYGGVLQQTSSALRVGARRLSAGTSLATVAVICAFAGLGIYQGMLPIGSEPLRYIRNTSIYDAVERMNQEKHAGFVTLDLAFRPGNGNLRDPSSIKKFHKLLTEAKGVSSVRRVHSIMDDVRHISQAVYDKPIPTTESETEFVFQNGIQSDDSYWKFQEQLEADDMWRFTVTTDREGYQLGRVRDSIRILAAENGYDIYPFGRNAVYPDVDQAIIQGKPRNALYGHSIVVLTVFLWILWRLWRRKQYSAWKSVTRSLRGGLLASVPFVFSTGVLILIMIGLSIPLDVATAAITALAINASVDFALYFVHVYMLQREAGNDHQQATEQAFELEGPAITADMVANSLCFVALLFSPFQPIWQLGLIMIAMLIAAWIGSLLLLPPTLNLIYT